MKHKTNASEMLISSDVEKNNWNDFITVFKWLSILFVLYTLPIILSDVLYKDDIRRVLYGDPSTWYRDGRPIMALILNSFSFGTPIFNTAPLPLLLGILILSFSLSLFYKKHLHNYDTLSVVLCLLMCIISPYFLENLSFNFESLGMCISLSLFIVLFSLPEQINKFLHFLVSAFFTICVSCIYQASLGAFFSLLFLTIFIELRKFPLKQLFKNIFYKIAGFCTGFLFYILLVAPHYVAKDGYQAEHSQFVPISLKGLDKIFSNLKGFFVYLKLMYFSSGNFFLTCMSSAVIVLTMIAIALYVKKLLSVSQEKSKYFKVLLCLLSPVLIIFFAFLPMCFLTAPNYMPRAFISFNVFLLFIGIAMIILSKKSRLFLLIFIPVYCFSYGFSFSYVNLLKSQSNYENYIAQSVVYDLNKIKGIDASCKFHIEGKKVIAKDVLLATKQYNIFKLIIPCILQKNNVYTSHLLSRFSTYRIDVSNLNKYNPKNYKQLAQNSLYRIMQNKKDVVIEFIFK